MYFRQLLHDDRSCASYLVGCPTYGPCAAIDPQGDPLAYVETAAAAGLEITHVVDTHVHADHPSAARALASVAGAELYVGSGAALRFDHKTLSNGDVIQVGNRRMVAMHTPGHTPEHVCLHVDEWFVLTGDTLFVGDVGRVDLATEEESAGPVRSRAAALHASLRRLASLPPETEIYPGHYAGSVCGRGMDGKPISTIGRELRHNRPLNLSGVTEFVEFQLANLPPMPDDFHSIKAGNLSGE